MCVWFLVVYVDLFFVCIQSLCFVLSWVVHGFCILGCGFCVYLESGVLKYQIVRMRLCESVGGGGRRVDGLDWVVGFP